MAIDLGRRACISGAVLVGSAGRVSAQPLRDVAMSLPSRSLVAAAAAIAKEMGFYAARGLSPRFTVMDSANGSTGALLSRSVEVAVSGSPEAVAAAARGQPVVIVASTYGGLSGSLVLAKGVADKLGVAPDGPIAERLRALDGLLIASTSATSSFTISYRGASRSAGATPRFTYMALPAMLAAMESGAVQGFAATAPYWTAPVVRGSGVLWISAPKGELPAAEVPISSANLQLLRPFAQANPGVVAGIQAAHADLIAAIDARPADVKAAIARLYPEIDAASLDFIYATEAPAWKPKPLAPADMAHEIAYVRSFAQLPPQADSLDPASLLYP